MLGVLDEAAPSSEEAAIERCEKLALEAERLEAAGQHLLAADKFLEGIFVARRLWKQARMACFERYTQIMQWHRAFCKSLTPEALETIDCIAKDKKELKSFRAKACYQLAMNAHAEGQHDVAADYYRSVLDLVAESHESRQLYSQTLPFPPGVFTERNLFLVEMGDDGVTQVPSKVGAYIDEMGERAKQCLGVVEGATEIPFVRQNLKTRWGTDDSIIDRMGAGGGKCDCCGKKAEEMESGELKRCSRCDMAHYCSTECQKKQWKEGGHNHACRKPGQIEVGDIMLVKGIVRKPELNRKLAKIIRPATAEGRWEVSVQGWTSTMSLASKNLFHIRPAK